MASVNNKSSLITCLIIVYIFLTDTYSPQRIGCLHNLNPGSYWQCVWNVWKDSVR